MLFALNLILWLRGVLAAGEGEVSFGVVGADPAAQDHREAEGEPAEQDKRRGEQALAPRLAPEEECHRRDYAGKDAPTDEERGHFPGKERLAPAAHARQGGGEEGAFDNEGGLLGAPEGAQGLLLPPVPEVEHEREEREGRGEAGGQEGRSHQHPVARPHRDGGRADQVSGVKPDEEAERQGEDREEAGRNEAHHQPGYDPSAEQSVLCGLAGGEQAREVAEKKERPALGGHRPAQLDDAEHVVEALGTPEVPDQEYRAQDHGEEHGVAAGADERPVLVTEELGNRREQVHPGPYTPDPEVDGDLPRPVGVLYRRDAVVVLVAPAGVGVG